MAKTFILGVVTLCLLHSTLAVTYTQAEIDDAVDACNGLIDDDKSFIAGLVRLAFHDCIEGCDGCVDTAIEDNGGLDFYITPLNEAYDDLIDNTMGRADFWATCFNAAAQSGFNNVPRDKRPDSLPINVTYGRVDGDCGNLPDRPFPNALGGLNETLAYFADNFGYDANETVALLGAHTLGKARIQNSGFNGPWVGREFNLDNQYYIAVVRPWRQVQQDVDGTLTKWQWIRPVLLPLLPHNETTLMLNSDICLAYEISPDAQGENAVPLTGQIADSATLPVVEHYEDDNNAWTEDFAKVFTKLISTGM